MNQPAHVPPNADADLDASLADALDAFRRDCRLVRPATRLAERVLSAVARGDDESSRFRRLARTYAAAAAVLAVASAAGSLLVHRAPAPPPGLSSPSPLADLEERGIARQWTVSVSDLTVGGR